MIYYIHISYLYSTLFILLCIVYDSQFIICKKYLVMLCTLQINLFYVYYACIFAAKKVIFFSGPALKTGLTGADSAVPVISNWVLQGRYLVLAQPNMI